MKTPAIPTLLCALLLCAVVSAGRAGDFTHGPNTGPAPQDINENWDDSNVSVSATDDDAIYNVGDVGAGVGGNLNITSSGSGDATLTFGPDVKSVEDPLNNDYTYMIHFTGDATLEGSRQGSPGSYTYGEAALEIKVGKDSAATPNPAGNILLVYGKTTVGDYSRVLVDGGTASLVTGSLAIDGDDALVRLANGGLLSSVGEAAITNGSLLIELGAADFQSGAVVNGAAASIIGENGIIRLGSSSLESDQEVDLLLTGGGVLEIRNNVGIVNAVKTKPEYSVKGTLKNEGGYLVVRNGGTLDATGIDKVVLDSDYTTLSNTHGSEVFGHLVATDLEFAGGTALIGGAGMAEADLLTVSGGVLDIELGGSAKGTDVRVGGGEVNVLGSIDKSAAASTLTVSGGRLVVGNGGLVNMDKVLVNGSGAVFRVESGGVIADQTEFTASAGIVNFMAGSDIAGGVSGAGLKLFNVSNTSEVNLNTGIATDEFGFSGTLNLLSGGALHVRHNSGAGYVQALAGRLNLSGGSAEFNDDVVVAGRDMGIYGTSLGGHIDLAGNSLKVEGLGRIDAEKANVTIVRAGEFDLSGIYVAGYDGVNITKLTITGMSGSGGLSVGDTADIRMSGDLQMYANSTNFAGGVGYRILDTDAAAYIGANPGPFDVVDPATGVTYTYEVRKDGAGYGLYATGAKSKPRDQQYNDIIAAWSRHPEVVEGVHNVLRPDYVNAIIDGNLIRVGLEGDYKSLSESGQFNARVLSSLISPATSTYDALMLYNGSGVGMMHQAVLNSNQQTMKRLSLRNQYIRREIELAQTVCNPCTDEWEQLGAGPANRVWASGHTFTDNSGYHDGFAGYKYRGKGLTVGYDRLFERLAVGGAFSYTGGDFNDQTAPAHGSEISTYGVHLYGNYQAANGTVVSGSLGYAYSDNKVQESRTLDGVQGQNLGDFGSNSLMAALTVGRDFGLGDYLILTPSAGLNYVDTRNSAHSQYFSPNDNSPGANTINVGKVTGRSVTVPLDLSVSYELYGTDESMFMLTGNIGYAYELHNKGAGGSLTYAGLNTVGPVRIASREAGRHVLNLGVNARYNYRQFELGLGYDFTGRKQYDSHTFHVTGGVVF